MKLKTTKDDCEYRLAQLGDKKRHFAEDTFMARFFHDSLEAHKMKTAILEVCDKYNEPEHREMISEIKDVFQK